MALLGVYISAVNLISGWDFLISQLKANWYWIFGLALGFGIQIFLFSYLRARHQAQVSGKMITVSGATSGTAMLACCAHYLVNILPIVGISGLAAVIGQYQTELFVLGLIANVIGIGYMINKLKQA